MKDVFIFFSIDANTIENLVYSKEESLHSQTVI